MPLPGGGYDERESPLGGNVDRGHQENCGRSRTVVLYCGSSASSRAKGRPLPGREGVQFTILKRKIIRFVADNEHRFRDIEPDMPGA